jgi:hypothetical protein
MDTAKYPTATFTLTKSIDFGSVPASGATVKVSAAGNLTMHGATKPVTMQLTVEHNGTTIEVLGSVPILFSDWNIAQPSFPGVAQAQDHGILEFLLRFTHGAAPAATGASTTTTTNPGFGRPGGFPPGSFPPGGRPPGGGAPGGGPGITVSPTTVAPLQLSNT